MESTLNRSTQKSSLNTHRNYNVIDLFSGCGGLSFGFLRAGYEVILGVDNDEKALETFRLNHPHAEIANIDLFRQDFLQQLDDVISAKSVDIVIAGPPCQGFSLTGPRKFDDPRNGLYLSVLKTIAHYNPKAFVIENVPGLASMYDGKIKDEIIKRCEEMGYRVKMKILLAADYGVPQKRRRVFFVGIRNDYGNFEFPKPIFNENNYVSCEEAIGDLPSRKNTYGEEVDNYSSVPTTKYQKSMRSKSGRLHNHVASKHTEKIINVISLVPDGGNHKDLPEGVGGHRKFNEAWTRYNSKKPSKTIDTGHRNHFHYKWDRVPTVRENARLQSFPDTFIFLGSRTQQNRQVGNAVPPLMAKSVAEKIAEALNE